jgi:hypothetical protein
MNDDINDTLGREGNDGVRGRFDHATKINGGQQLPELIVDASDLTRTAKQLAELIAQHRRFTGVRLREDDIRNSLFYSIS